jgi:hypothetical protein
MIWLCVTGASARARQQQQQPQQAQPREHVVKRGDTLWGLAQIYFSNPFLWPVIFEANRTVVEDPHWIYPEERLVVPATGQGLAVAVRDMTPVEPPQGVNDPAVAPTGRTRFYRPAPAPNRERETALISRRAPLYVVPPAEYYSAAWLADSATLGIRGRLLGMADPTRQRDRLPPVLHPYDRVLAGWLRGDASAPGDTLLVVRVEQPVRGLGDVIVPLAIVRVDSVGESVMEARVLRQFGAAKVGDFLLPLPALPEFHRRMPQPVEGGAEGRLVAFLAREPLYSTLDNGFIDLGRNHGIEIGDVLVGYVPARPGASRSQELPDEVIATFQVIRVTDASATVRVSGVSSTALRAGVAVRVVRKVQ